MQPSAQSGPSILIVDDEPSIREVLCHMAKGMLQADVMEARDGREALFLFAQKEPDIVITDIRMPGMDGVTLLKELKEKDPTIPVIIITGFPSLKVAIHAMKEGASDFITKPFQLEQVQVVLEKALRERKVLRENMLLKEEVHIKRKLEQLNEQLHRRMMENSALYSLGENIASFPFNRDAIIRSLIQVAKEVLKARSVYFMVPDGGRTRLRMLLRIPEGPHNGLDEGLWLQDRSCLDKVLRQKEPIIHEGGSEGGEFRSMGAGEIPGDQSKAAVPLMIKDEIFGVLCAEGKYHDSGFDQQDLLFLAELSKRASLGLENNYLYEGIFEVLMSTLRSLVSTIEAKDPYTREHSQRVTECAILIAEEMGCTPEQIDTLRVAGYLHDLGKLGVKDSVLLKPGRLTAEEYEQIKDHPVIGERILVPIAFLTDERSVIRHHHERWDGNGYPDGLKGAEIPFLARILTVADAFDAMTSNRTYRSARTFEEAREEVRSCRETQFDPDVVDAFMIAYDQWVAQISNQDAMGFSSV